VNLVSADTWSSSGCYSSINVATSKGTYTYQSSGYCQTQCAGYRIAALKNGNECYCGNTDPSGSTSNSCNVKCDGYPDEMCGGSSSYTVFVNADVDSSNDSSSSSSSSSTSTTSSKTSSSSTSTSSTSSSTSTSSTSSSSSTDQPSTTTIDETTTEEESQSTTTSSSSSTSSPSTTSTSSTSSRSPSTTTIVSSTVISGSPSVIYRTVIATPSTSSLPSSTSSSADNTSSPSPTTSSTPTKNKSVSGGTIAGAVVGSVVGAALIAGLILFFCWYRRRKNEDDEDFDDQFTLSGPKTDMTQPNGPTSGLFDSNPFLLAGGYNNFDTSQQQQQQGHTPGHSQSLSTPSAAGVVGAHKYNSSSGTSGDGTHSFGSHTDNDYVIYGTNEYNSPHQPSGHSNGGSMLLDSPNPEYGRRKLSNGSLPDMIARQPGSLKVVNN
ncbi:hypothetical protein G210_4886, partial [Candida maltosa Xu316]